MTDRLAVTLTVDELAALIKLTVGHALSERAESDTRTRDLAGEEMTRDDVLTLFHLSKKSGPKTVWRWRRERAFPAPHHRGGRVRWLRVEVDAWRAAQGISGPGAVTLGRRRRTEDGAATAAH